MIVAVMLAWIAFGAFAISGLAWLDRRRSPPPRCADPEPGSPVAARHERPLPPSPAPLAPATAAPRLRL